MRSQPRRLFDRRFDPRAKLAATAKFAILLGALAAVVIIFDRGGAPATSDLPVPVADEMPSADGKSSAAGDAVAQSASAPDTAGWQEIDPGDYQLSATGPEPVEASETDTSETDLSEAATPRAEQRVLRVRRGDTLSNLLRSAGISQAEAHEAVSALRSVYNPRNLQPGQEITLRIGTGEEDDQLSLLGASLNASAEHDIDLSRDAEGRFTALRRDKDLKRELLRATSTVSTSLFEAGGAAGVPGTVMVEFVRAFSYDVDFQRDIHPGDAFEIVFERFRDADGNFAKDGNILYTTLTVGGVTRRLYRYAPEGDTAGFFDERGEDVRRALLRTPVDGARLSSGFGTRHHPILGYSAMHKGVDFAAPTGTPIQAAGNGVVEMAGWNGGYGRYVRIRHNAEYATAYAHMSRIARTLRPGDRVKQGEVIGYVGSTGRSTGPHLHYEIIRRGTAVNPVTVQMPTGRKLKGSELAQFQNFRTELDVQVAAIEPTKNVARIANADEEDKDSAVR